MAATVDHIAAGRLILGLGAGGSRVTDPAGTGLVEREFGAYGIEVVSPAEALSALGEASTLIRRMWTEVEPFDFVGRHYRLKDVVCEPKPIQRPGPPISADSRGLQSQEPGAGRPLPGDRARPGRDRAVSAGHRPRR
jgi:alkanesulfonate monooxygenase SsuD/methylene tetrahydromethanopterin reductase-like flavin-dependent oxidoreductase (luciferase family)